MAVVLHCSMACGIPLSRVLGNANGNVETASSCFARAASASCAYSSILVHTNF
jgi:hypothetical protein